MEDKMLNNLPTARFSNELATKGRVNFANAREWIIFLYLVAQLDPKNQGKLTDAIVWVQDLENLLKTSGKKWGGLYAELKQCAERMGGVTCKFDTDVEIDGKVLPKVRPIFSEIDPFKTNDGAVFIRYCFNERMAPLLLGFKKNFMGIKPPVGINSGHAIRFLILAKAERDRKRKYEKVTRLYYGIDELKALLSISGKYKEFDNFRRRVIEPIIEGVNKSGIVDIVNYEKHRTGRKVTHIAFYIQDAVNYKPIPTVEQAALDMPLDDEPSMVQLEALTFARYKAYMFLVDMGVKHGIAYGKILPSMPKGEVFNGYEDFFCEEAFKIVAERSKAQTKNERAAVFVTWFKKGDIFGSHQYGGILESVHDRKKKLDNEAQMNREQAAKMTVAEFKIWYKKREEELKAREAEEQKGQGRQDGFEGLADLTKRFDMG